MIILIILFITISIFLIKKYFSIREKILGSEICTNDLENYSKLALEIKASVDIENNAPNDGYFTKENNFKFNFLNIIILRGFYRRLDLKLFLNSIRHSDYVSDSAMKVLDEIYNEINVFTYLSRKIKIFRRLVMFNRYLNVFVINNRIIIEHKSLWSALCRIPSTILYTKDLANKDKDWINNFIRFYDYSDNPLCWYRKD